ncbi:MAG: hypothetical protein HOW73_35450 [Polyangiaceae bacterium]|nr:hypothetical protein [Polyangiaceae bacterium]
MRHNIAIGLTAVVCLVTPEAFAQQAAPAPIPPPEEADVEPLAPPGTILAPKNALELQFEAGYTQPFGGLTGTTAMSDVAQAGFTGGGALVYRISPLFGLSGYGGFHHLTTGDDLDGGMVFGGAGGVAANFHLRPYNLVDPYFIAGAGYRLLFVSPDGPADNHMYHGFQPLKANFGVDFRTSESFAIGPMIGADLNVLLWDFNMGTGVNELIQRDRISTFLFAGVSGKFDVLGERVPQHEVKEPLPAAGPLPERARRRPAPQPAPATPPAPPPAGATRDMTTPP